MVLNAVIEAATQEFTQNLMRQCENLAWEQLTPTLAEQVTAGLKQALSAAGVAGLQTFLEHYEVQTPTLTVEGQVYRQKLASAKTFLTAFGSLTLTRNLYQADVGGPTYVPVDVGWGMVGEFATVEVREAILVACALVTPEETAQLLHHSAWFHPSVTAIQQIVRETGRWVETQGEEVHQAVRQNDRQPVPAQTAVLAASLDGVLVRLREEGTKRGAPAARITTPPATTTPTTFRQAMVGSISCYGPPETDRPTPPRLQSRYVAQMPEAQAPTGKRRFEEEVRHALTHLPPTVKKVLLLDGAGGLWHYAETEPLWADFEKLVDFYHTTEHLAQAAEVLFGLGSKPARQWYDTYYQVLLEVEDAGGRIVRSLDYYRRGRRFSALRQTAFQAERTFFQRNRHRMTYARFRRQGWPIGSGPVEAACKSLVKTRLGRSGMQWSWAGGQHILQLRTWVKSHRWESFWQEYKVRHYAAYPLAA